MLVVRTAVSYSIDYTLLRTSFVLVLCCFFVITISLLKEFLYFIFQRKMFFHIHFLLQSLAFYSSYIL